MFGTRLVVLGAVLLVLLGVALGAARPSSGAAPETRYVVRAGDTLWAIAERELGGDPRAGVHRLKEANGLGREPLQPGDVLVVPR